MSVWKFYCIFRLNFVNCYVLYNLLTLECWKTTFWFGGSTPPQIKMNVTNMLQLSKFVMQGSDKIKSFTVDYIGLFIIRMVSNLNDH